MSTRLKERAKAEEQFVKCLALLDYSHTKDILEAIYEAVLSGVEPQQITYALEILSTAQRLSRVNEIKEVKVSDQLKKLHALKKEIKKSRER